MSAYLVHNPVDYPLHPLGQLHRDDGSVYKYSDGTEYWYLNDQLHRVGGAAIVFPNGAEWWFLYGEKHRDDGPAVSHQNGNKEWWLNGKQYTHEEFILLQFSNGITINE